MAKLLKLRRGSTTAHASFTGAEGEVTIDTTKDTAVVHDGSQAGGRPLAREDMTNVSSASIAGRLSNDSIATDKIAAGNLPSDVKIVTANITDGTIVNADISTNAAIAGTKINPDFGSQQITTTGNISVGGTVDGRDIAGDGGKLDLIENNATADQTAAEIRTLVESASDSNVFTDADHTKLNGIEASATADQTASEIVALVADQTIAPSEIDMEDSEKIKLGTGDDLQIYHDGVQSYVYDSGTGDLNLQTNGAKIKLGKDNGETCAAFIPDGAVELYYDNSKKFETVTGGVSVTGNMTASGNVTAYSDARLKTEIHTINDALGIVGKLRGVSYKWLRNGQSDIGVIAQEVEKVIPEIVKTTEVAGLDGMEEVKSVDYGKIVGVLINAINELKAEVEELKGGK